MTGIESSKITVDLAEKVINQLIKQGGYRGSMPDTEADQIKMAKVIISQAYEAKKILDSESGKNDHVEAIIRVCEGVEAEPPLPGKPQSVVEELSDPVDLEPKKPKKDLKSALDEVQEILRKENLPEPSPINEDPKPIPSDLTALDNTQIRQLHSQFNAAHLRTAWLAGIEESYLSDCEVAAKASFSRSMDGLEKIDENGKSKQITLLKEEAANDEEYRSWISRAEYHRSRHKSFKLLVEIYDKACERLSREWTMRTDQFHQSGK